MKEIDFNVFQLDKNERMLAGLWKPSQDEVLDPRQVWARRTWVADKGVPCDRAHILDKFSVASLRLAHT